MFRTTRTLVSLALTLAIAGPALAGPPGKPPAPKPFPQQHQTPTFQGTFNGTTTTTFHATTNFHATTFHTPTVTPTTFPNYHLVYGTKFAHGFFYKGFNHAHWSKIYFHPVFGVRVYFDPFTLVEYYWCPPDNAFYPLAYRPYGTLIFP
jgi:hypothetical protein